MSNENHNVTITAGDGSTRVRVSKLLTMVDGQVSWAHGLRKFRVVGASIVHASAIPDESWGILGTPNADGWLVSDTGVSTVDSSDAASTSTGFITIEGFGG